MKIKLAFTLLLIGWTFSWGSLTPSAVGAPSLGKSMEVDRVSGTVLVGRVSNDLHAVVSRRRVALPAVVDVTHGRVDIITARDRTRTQTVRFAKGRFRVMQSPDGDVSFRLLDGSRKTCELARAARRRRRPSTAQIIAQLYGQSKGSHKPYTVQGDQGSTTTYGTTWITANRCDGTFTKVISGTALVTQTGPTAHAATSQRASTAHIARTSHVTTSTFEVTSGGSVLITCLPGSTSQSFTCMAALTGNAAGGNPKTAISLGFATTDFSTAETYRLCIAAPAQRERCHSYDLGPLGFNDFGVATRAAGAGCTTAGGGTYQARWLIGSRQVGEPVFFNLPAPPPREIDESGLCLDEATLNSDSDTFNDMVTFPAFRYSPPIGPA